MVYSNWCSDTYHISCNVLSACIHECKLLPLAGIQSTIRPSAGWQPTLMDHVRSRVCYLALPQSRFHKRLLTSLFCLHRIGRCLPTSPVKIPAGQAVLLRFYLYEWVGELYLVIFRGSGGGALVDARFGTIPCTRAVTGTEGRFAREVDRYRAHILGTLNSAPSGVLHLVCCVLCCVLHALIIYLST